MLPAQSFRRLSSAIRSRFARPNSAALAAEYQHAVPSEEPTLSAGAAEAQRTVNRPILVVEDDAGVQTMLLMALEDAEYPVEIATNGEEALEQLDRTQPRLILLDMRMPIMDGPTFLRTIYSQPGRSIPPIIVMTAYRDVDPTAVELGLPSISKPMDMAQLMRLIERYMRDS